MRFWRTLSRLLALALFFVILPASAEDVRLDSQIAELERLIAQHDKAAAPGKANPTKEMTYIVSLTKLATLYMQADRLQDTWPLSEKILKTAEKLFGTDNPNIVSSLEAVASSYGLQGRFAEAEALRKRAIAINEHAYGGDSLNVAFSLQGMSSLFSSQGRHDEALAFAKRALAIADRKLPAGDPQRAIYLTQLAQIHMSARQFDAAEPELKQALDLVGTTRGLSPAVAGAQTIQILQSLGLAAYGRERNAEGQAYVDRAIETSTQLFGPEHTLTQAMLVTLAVQLTDQGKLPEADRLYRRALALGERNGGSQAMLGQIHLGLGLVSYQGKAWRDAYIELLKASAISIDLEKIAAGNDAGSAASRLTPHADTFLLAAVAAFRTAEAEPKDLVPLRNEAFRLAQRAEHSQAAGALAQMAARIGARSGPLAKLVRERQDLANEWRSLDKAVEQVLVKPQAQRADGDDLELRKRMAEISARLDEVDAQITTSFPEFAKLSDPDPLSIEEVQRQLGPKELMIFIVSRPKQSLVWAIGPATAAWDLVPVGEDDLGREVSALRCGLDVAAWQGDGAQTCSDLTGRVWRPGAALPFDLERAHKLYKTLLAPFAPMLQDAQLIVTTAGPLSLLPLQVLVTGPPASAFPADAAGYAGAGWLAKQHAIANLPSVASLKTLRALGKASQAQQPYLGVANPELTGPDASFADIARAAKANRSCAATFQNAQGGTTGGQMPKRAIRPVRSNNGLVPSELIRAQIPLPETAEEVCAVARDFGVSEQNVRLAGRATESEIKRLSSSGDLAKYGIVHFATHGALAGQISRSAEAGLLLTPPDASTSNDDGYLTTSEITDLKLDADWVILSACNTAAGGQVGGEALSGLARAFFYAQARSVLVSHWEVESKATVQLITAAAGAYRRNPGIGRAEALRRAIATLIGDPTGRGAHPSFWAPFVLVGEGGDGR